MLHLMNLMSQPAWAAWTEITLRRLYEGIDADIEKEITADIIGDYVFTDEAFVKNLSTKQPNIFQKIYNHIKHLVKMATAGSKEAKQLEQIKNTFDKAYKEMSKATTGKVDSNLATEADGNIRYSLNDIENMSRKDYNNHGWAKVNDVLTNSEFADFMTKVGIKERQNNHWYLDLHNGKHMFAVGVDGVNNILIVSDGNFNNPSIERVYHIGLDNETDIENVRDGIYARENRNFALSSEIIQDYWRDEPVYVYGPSDFFSYEWLISEYEGKYGKRNLGNNKRLQNRKRSN